LEWEYQTHKHEIKLIEDWVQADIDYQWGVVLVDHKPEDRRAKEIERLADTARIIIVHDTEPNSASLYNYSSIYSLFKYRYDYTKTKVHTTVLSNFHDLSFLHNS
jgi:hypothetical protein